MRTTDVVIVASAIVACLCALGSLAHLVWLVVQIRKLKREAEKEKHNHE